MLLYRGTGKYYVENLIFSLHFYAFDFLAKCLVALVYLSEGLVGHTTFLISRGVYYAAAFVYLLFALKRVYAQSWKTTSVKAIVQFLFEVILFIAINAAGFILAAFWV